MTAIQCIARIQDLLDEWRALGSRRLGNGVELIGHQLVDDEEVWLHAVHPALTPAAITTIEHRLGSALPPDLRTFFRCVGGIVAFSGLFEVHGLRHPGLLLGERAVQPGCLVTLNHEIDALGWRRGKAVAFAENRWDMSVYVAGQAVRPGEIQRCERATGRVLETHESVFACVAARLTRLDELCVK